MGKNKDLNAEIIIKLDTFVLNNKIFNSTSSKTAKCVGKNFK